MSKTLVLEFNVCRKAVRRNVSGYRHPPSHPLEPWGLIEAVLDLTSDTRH